MAEQAIALSREQLLRVLDLARMAPSGANGQPWHFEWDGRELRVFFERHRTPGAVDADGRGTWIIVGTFLECLEIAAGRDGLGIAYRLLLPYADDRPVAAVTFSAASVPGSQGGLASTLAARFTDRRRYRGRPPGVTGGRPHPRRADRIPRTDPFPRCRSLPFAARRLPGEVRAPHVELGTVSGRSRSLVALVEVRAGPHP